MVEDPGSPGLLDFCIFYPLDRAGYKLSHAAHEKAKHTKCTIDKQGRRAANLVLIPVVANVFGKLNTSAEEWFSAAEDVARHRGRPYNPMPGQPRRLKALAALMAILLSAEGVYHAYSQPRVEEDLEEALHYCETCGRLRGVADLPVSCAACLGGKTMHRHDHESCKRSRCGPSCSGRLQAVA